MKKIFLIGSLISSFSIVSLFADNCDNPRDDFDGLYCLNKVYIVSDKDLNSAYKTLRSFLSKEGRKVLQENQNIWIKKRNSECSFYNDRGFFVNLKCATDLTIGRTNFLNDRIRECKATGCQESKL